MKGDFTRDTFDAAKQFSRVLMQQGRVQVDADWNEQTSILLHYLQTLARDIFGPHAGPAGALGFGLATKDHPVDLDALDIDPERRQVLKKHIEAGDILIGPGRYYVRGMMVENAHYTLYSEQAGYPFADGLSVGLLPKQPWLAYLDVWERHVSCVEDDDIREVALGGPDTASRAQLVWQVKALARPDNAELFDCDSIHAMTARRLPLLRARAQQPKAPTELCVISPEATYRGAENQLYRVEVHRGGVASDNALLTPTFKWSRENGSVIFPVQLLNGASATLEHLGPDQCLGLQQGDWVEALDDRLTLSGHSGPLAQVVAVDRDRGSVTLAWADEAAHSYSEAEARAWHALLRRWDHVGDPALDGALAVRERAADEAGLAGGWLELEDGVQVWFGQVGAVYRSGDYWLIPARVATGDVEWPDDVGPGGKPVAAARQPHGPRHAYAPLFLMSGGGVAAPDGRAGQDCRCMIAPLPCVVPA
ncbi:MAG: DUF6519 domain-containing protein [Pseudomonadota bacterium]